jgi:hypothetical protein
MIEPRSDLARYAFGYSDKKPGWLFWLIHLAMVAFIAWFLLGGHAQAHCFSIWKYPHAQRCGGSNRPPVASSIAKRMTVPAGRTQPPPEPSFDIPLPDPDPLTTALRMQLQ